MGVRAEWLMVYEEKAVVIPDFSTTLSSLQLHSKLSQESFLLINSVFSGVVDPFKEFSSFEEYHGFLDSFCYQKQGENIHLNHLRY